MKKEAFLAIEIVMQTPTIITAKKGEISPPFFPFCKHSI